jgi:hypothetical protein
MRGCLRHAIAREPADVSREREREFEGSEILCSYAAEPLQRGLVSASEPDEGFFVISYTAVSVRFWLRGGKSCHYLPVERSIRAKGERATRSYE